MPDISLKTCATCGVTTPDLTGWYLVQVSTAEFIAPDGVVSGTLTTLYCHDTDCLEAWCGRAALPTPRLPATPAAP